MPDAASATSLHGYGRPVSMRAMIRAASMSSGCPAAVYVAMTAIPLETGGWRDEWLVADGAAQGDGNRRIYVIRTWLQHFRLSRDRPRYRHGSPGTGRAAY